MFKCAVCGMIQRMCVYFSSNDISNDVTWEKVRQSSFPTVYTKIFISANVATSGSVI